ncbi:hypothetical protein [Nostoc sp. 'Peltigera malacea cyanobiont' DB3992]|uniref:hypothetical protein n=1 Tax=Nostoc sp. 'Peltigera malacea cyanobiont' DB3992 TaxID=1206980 RepID=UPI000C03C6E5|nr:hypothetical protein [Nostoc sp. 'Peltigera malacea cyanobiont' DB3992]PHM06965.1 hypothetical protein CK516_30085 [Nostoc sp. 'Peltigera malacea cyanobiont' DB3992]
MISTVIAPHPQPLPKSEEGRQSIALAGWGSSGLIIIGDRNVDNLLEDFLKLYPTKDRCRVSFTWLQFISC